MTKKILIVGAGRSSATLVKYLLSHAEEKDWWVMVGDRDLALPEQRIKGHVRGRAFAFNALDVAEREPKVAEADLVISMLPARYHVEVLKDCIKHRKPFVAPSYVSKEIKALEMDIIEAGIPVIMEIGLDPGIDHMSAIEVIDRIKDEGSMLQRFESFTGGLVAPESDNNPWNYKFTWNPRNVVLAGAGGPARFIHKGRYKYTPYHRLFTRVKPIEIRGHGSFEGYANRDSLKYREVYDLGDIPTIYRGTLRRKGFCESWNVFVQLGMTDDSFQVDNCEEITWRGFTNSFLPYSIEKTVEEKLQKYTGASNEVMTKLKWLGIFDDELIGVSSGTPAQILQKRLESKWGLEDGDKDMIVMWHRFNYMHESGKKEVHSSMVVIGEDEENTAMAMTVGLPVAMASKLILQGKCRKAGIHFPTSRYLYEPILEELKEWGVTFNETVVD